jgi:predicted translin family RNA/ssDNA-binding protein
MEKNITVQFEKGDIPRILDFLIKIERRIRKESTEYVDDIMKNSEDVSLEDIAEAIANITSIKRYYLSLMEVKDTILYNKLTGKKLSEFPEDVFNDLLVLFDTQNKV